MLAGWLFVGTLIAALVAVHRPLGGYMARVLSASRHTGAERTIYRLGGIDRDAQQSWRAYLRAVLAFSAVGVVFLYVLLRVQQHLGRPFAVPQMSASQAFITAGAVDSAHDSYTSLAGGTLMLNMMLGEVAPGGTRSGLYGILILAVVTVCVARLIVGRTPEYLGKKLRGREIEFASLYLLTTPALVLIGTAVAMALPARGLTLAQVRAVVAAHRVGRDLGFLGQPYVEVLQLNLALDKEYPYHG